MLLFEQRTSKHMFDKWTNQMNARQSWFIHLVQWAVQSNLFQTIRDNSTRTTVADIRIGNCDIVLKLKVSAKLSFPYCVN